MKDSKKIYTISLSDLSKLIYEGRKRLGLTQSELAKRAGVSLRTIQLWEMGKTAPQPHKLRLLSEAIKVPLDALTGGGLKSNASQPVPLKSMFPRRVPVVSWAKAGLGGNFRNLAFQIDEWIDTDCRDLNAYALIIEGDSMLPEFKPGDRVVFMPNVEPRNGDIVVAMLASTEDVFFKLFHRVGEKGEIVRLTSFNPAYPPLEYHVNEFEFIHPMYSMIRMRRS